MHKSRLRGIAAHVAAGGETAAEPPPPPEQAQGALSWAPTPDRKLSAADIALFEDQGLLVLRNLLSAEEMERLAGPQRAAFESLEYDGRDQLADPTKVYPAPGVYSMGPRILATCPEIGAVSCGHPSIVAAVEALFGEPATLAQFWSIMRPPGAGVPTGTDAAFVPGKAAHYDYKPWRCVGSLVKWMFVVIPFVDYTPDAGPLAVAPGSYKRTTVLPSDGRVHRVDASQVPRAADVGPMLLDPQLRRSDVVLMHGFTWHEAWPNKADIDRCGLYMKFHAKSSPPACGPTIYPTAVRRFLGEVHPETQHVIPYHRDDGQFAQVCHGSFRFVEPLKDPPPPPPVIYCIPWQVSRASGNHHGVDEARLLIEDPAGSVLLVPRGNGWSFPCCAAAVRDTTTMKTTMCCCWGRRGGCYGATVLPLPCRNS